MLQNEMAFQSVT